MASNPIKYSEVDGLVTMLLVACEDRAINDTLELLLSQPDAERREVVYKLLDRLRENQAPRELINAIACLLDDQVAEKAYEVIFQCGKKLG